MGLERLIGVLSVMVKANTAQYEAGMSKSARETANAARAVKAAEREFFALTRQIQNAGRATQDVGRTLTVGVTLPLLAAGGAAVKTSIAWESSFAGVRKTTKGTAEDMRALEQGLLGLAARVPETTSGLAAIAESGGQLGVAKENLLGFTETIAGLASATNLTAEAGANGLARIALLTGASQGQFGNIGSAIVALGNAGATTETEIVSMGLRIAAAGKGAGMTTADVLGLAAALSNTGIEAEAGGSAISKIINDITKAVAEGGAALNNYAAVSGMTAAQFSSTWKKSASEGLTAFLRGLGRQDGPEALRILDQLGIIEIRTADAARRLAQSGDNLSSSLALASLEFQKNTALTEEAQARYATTESRLSMLRNRIETVAVTFGAALAPAIGSAIALIDRLLPVAQRLAEGFGRLPGGAQATVLGMLAIAAAAGPLLFALGATITSVGGAMRVMQEFGIQAQLMAARTAVAAAGTRALAVANAALGPGMALLNGVTLALANSTLVLSVRQRAAAVATWLLAVAQRAQAAIALLTSGAMTGLLARLMALPAVQTLAAATTATLSAVTAILGTTLSVVAVAALAAGAAFLGWKVGEYIGEVTGATDALGRWVAGLYGGIEAQREYDRNVQSGAFGRQGEEAEEAAKKIKTLQDQLSGREATRGMADLETAVRGLAQQGRMTQDVLARIVEQADQLAASGGKMSAYMQALVSGAKLNQALIDALDKSKPGGKVALDDGKKKGMSAEEQARALAQTRGARGELEKLRAESRGTYESMLTDIRLAIGERLREAAGVAALVAALTTLQAAQVQAAQAQFIRQQLGSLPGDAAAEVRDLTTAFDLAAASGQLFAGNLEPLIARLTELAAQGAPGAAQALARVTAEFDKHIQVLPRARNITLDLRRTQAEAARTGETWITTIKGEVLAQVQAAYAEAARKTAIQDAARSLRAAGQISQQQYHSIVGDTKRADEQTQDFAAGVRDLAAAFQVLGIDAKSGMGQMLGGITAGLGGLKALQKAGTKDGAFAFGNLFKGGAGAVVSNISAGLQAAQAAVQIGKGIARLFGLDPVSKAAKAAGQVLGGHVSREMAQAILDRAKELGISVQQASLLAIDQMLAKSGKSVGSMSQQVGQLFAGLQQGAIPAKQGVEELGKLFSRAGDEAASIGKSYNASTVAMIAAARQTGVALPGMAEAVAAALDKVIAGWDRVIFSVKDGKFLGGLDPTGGALTLARAADAADAMARRAAEAARSAIEAVADASDEAREKAIAQAKAAQSWARDAAAQAADARANVPGIDDAKTLKNAQAQGALWAQSFWVVVGERGLVAASDAFRKQFGSLRESFGDILPKDTLNAMLGPVERIMALTAPADDNGPASLFRGAAEAASGLKDVIDGLAASGYLTADSLRNAGLMAANAREQALAGGATEAEALQAIKPLLQANLDAAAAYGLQLDDNTAELVRQSEAAGLTFRVDPMMQMVDLLKVIAKALGAEIPASASATSRAVQGVGGAADSAAGQAGRAFGAMGEEIARTGTESARVFSEAITQGVTAAVTGTSASFEQLGAASESGWDRVGAASTRVLDGLQAQLDRLAVGAVVPIEWRTTGDLTLPDLGRVPFEAPRVPRAAAGAYVRRSTGGSLVTVGEGGADEIVAPVDAMLRLAFETARGGPGALDVGPLASAMRAEMASLRAVVAGLADRPIKAAVHLDGRELADSHVEQLAAGNTKLQAATQRAAAGRRAG